MDKKKINLLIVDDEKRFLESMKRRLELRGFNVIAVDRGEKAIEAAGEHDIDMALVDLKMPGMGGEAVLEALKREHPWLEVVILTGHGSMVSASECARKGACSYLPKPCELDQILEVLARAYRKRCMNRMKIGKVRMDEMLGPLAGRPPLEVIRRLKELVEKD
ncbi:MAG: response regulator [Pseudomonadota bacterium]